MPMHLSSRRGRLGSGLAVTCLVAVGLATPSPAVPAPGSEASTLPLLKDADLAGVSGSSARQVWAVGSAVRGREDVVDYALRWDGRSWSRVFVPIPGEQSELLGVSALSANDAWAVGYYSVPGSGQYGLILHWNGAAWTQVPSATHGTDTNLQGVGGSGPDDVWAVGFRARALIEHWDGHRWRTVPAPTHNINDQLYSVRALSPSDAWAVGERHLGPPMVYHWDGSTWSLAHAPHPPGLRTGSLTSVDGRSSDDVWAVGNTFRNTSATASGGPLFQQLIEHFDGTHWTVIRGPHVTGSSILTGVSETSPNDVWATGYLPYRRGFQALIEHWNGHRWSVSTDPFPGAGLSVYGADASDAWVVGYQGAHSLRAHWNGSTWSH
jgi:hypothetical protein